MKRATRPKCQYGCRFLQITEKLWLCPHTSYGQSSYLRGAVDLARDLVERNGGYNAMLEDVLEAEAKRKRERNAPPPRASGPIADFRNE